MAQQGMVITTGDGRRLDNIKEWSIRSEFSRGPDEWSAVVYDGDISKLRLLELQAVEITVNGGHQLSGRIERTQTGTDGTTVVVSGRDFRGDMASCHVDPTFRINKSEPLSEAIKRVCAPLGITSVLSDGNWARRSALSGIAGRAPAPKGFQAAKAEDFKPKPEESIWRFVRRLAARFGATVQAGEGRHQIVLAQPNYEQAAAYSIRRRLKSGANNNVKWTQAERNYRDAPTYCVVAGKQWKSKGKSSGVVWSEGPVYLGRPNTINERVKPGDERPGDAKDLYRMFFRRAGEARTQEEVDLSFNRAIAERFHDLLHYSVELEGWVDRQNGHTWTIDTLVDVDDEVADVKSRLWVHSREMKYSQSSGPSTSLECWLPETFNLGSPLGDLGIVEPTTPGNRGGSGAGRKPPVVTIGYGFSLQSRLILEAAKVYADPRLNE